MKKTVLLAIAFGLLVLGMLVYTSMGTAKYRVEICITFRGSQACRTASGPTEQAALRTATENACAQISSGVTDSNQCQNTPPDRVRWLAREPTSPPSRQ